MSDTWFDLERATRGRFTTDKKMGIVGDPVARAILLQIGQHKNWKKNGTVWTSAATIAAETGYSERSVAGKLLVLVEAGWLRKIGPKGRGVEYAIVILRASTSAPPAVVEVSADESDAHDLCTSCRTTSASPADNQGIDQEEREDPRPPTTGTDWVEPILREHWGVKGRITRRHVQAVHVMVEAGWSRAQIEHVLTTNVDTADHTGALTTRLNRIVNGTKVQTYEQAMRDQGLLGMLGLRKPKRRGGGSRATSAPGPRDGYGPTGAQDWATGEAIEGDPWARSLDDGEVG